MIVNSGADVEGKADEVPTPEKHPSFGRAPPRFLWHNISTTVPKLLGTHETIMARTKHNKPSGRGPPKDGVSHQSKKKRKASEAELEENGDGGLSKRKVGIEDVLQNSSNDVSGSDALVHSSDPMHPANHICTLCRKFYDHGWVTGTGGGVSIKGGNHIFIAPSGVQKELMRPTDMFVMDFESQAYLHRPAVRPPYDLLLSIAVTY